MYVHTARLKKRTKNSWNQWRENDQMSKIIFPNISQIGSLDLEHYMHCKKLLYLCSFCIDDNCSSLTLCSASTRSTRSLISPITAVYCDTESPFSILSGNRYGRTLVAITSLVRPSLASDIVNFKIPKWKKKSWE